MQQDINWDKEECFSRDWVEIRPKAVGLKV